MKVSKASLIKKYTARRKNVINPDDISKWSDLGFDKAPEGYDSIDDYLNGPECDMDERMQVEIQLIDEFLEDLAKL